jgi:hypothetical protein
MPSLFWLLSSGAGSVLRGDQEQATFECIGSLGIHDSLHASLLFISESLMIGFVCSVIRIRHCACLAVREVLRGFDQMLWCPSNSRRRLWITSSHVISMTVSL